ncbi:hypothetical protein C8J46_109107 [Sphingomonas sp. PP-F2F-A104-K0414]|nr:hypothetical protein C8J46_109107 [Sphingomonas sp. PP-F2F-A104-K0414]
MLFLLILSTVRDVSGSIPHTDVMERYFLYLNEPGSPITDDEGFLAMDLNDAIRVAIAGAREIMAADILSGKLCLAASIEIVNGQGATMHTAWFKDIVLVTDR